jgi:Uncharacterized conserved protein
MKQIQILYFILVAFLISNTAFAQNQNSVEESPYIEVAGYAEQEVIPDEIYIGFTLRERYVNKEKETMEQLEKKLIDVIKKLDIHTENLTLADANSGYVRVNIVKRSVLAKKDYLLKVADAATVGKVFEEFERIEITGATITKVRYSGLDSLKKAVKIAAIKDAKEKADYLLESIGEKTGKPLIVKEDIVLMRRESEEIRRTPGRSVSNGYDSFNFNSVAGFSSVDGYIVSPRETSEQDPVIQFQKIKISSSIYVKFSIQ